MSEDEKFHSGNLVSDGSDFGVKAVEALECGKEKNLSSSIEEEMGKVSLAGAKRGTVSDGDGSEVPVDESSAKSGIVTEEKESESDTESGSGSSTSSWSSSSSNDDEEEEEDEDEELKVEVKEKAKRELDVPGVLEEGEIEAVVGEELIGGVDDVGGDDEEEDEGEMTAGVGFDVDADIDIDDGDEIGGGATEGPIRSKNELQVCDCGCNGMLR